MTVFQIGKAANRIFLETILSKRNYILEIVASLSERRVNKLLIKPVSTEKIYAAIRSSPVIPNVKSGFIKICLTK